MKLKNLIFLLLPILLFSCATTQHEPLNRGVINPNNLPEEELATLYIAEFLTVNKINNEKVQWNWQIKWSGIQYQVAKIPQGINDLYVSFDNGGYHTNSSSLISADFEGGKTYILISNPDHKKSIVSYHIYLYDDKEKTKGEEVTIPRSILFGNYKPAYMDYFAYVLSPAIKRIVVLENEEFIIEFKPDMIYTLANKKTKRNSEGRAGFVMDPKTSSGTVYLYETNISTMSKDQFLAGPYQEEAQIVLKVLNCSQNEVKFRYEKPVSQKGTEVIFSIK